MEYEAWCFLNTKEAAGKANGFLQSSAFPVALSFKQAGINPGDIVLSALRWQPGQGHSGVLHGF